MTDSGSASDGTELPAGRSTSVGRFVGWVVTILGVLVIVATVGVSLYLMVSAQSGLQFVGWFFTMLFFGAFPAMMGLGLVIWGGRIVHRARSTRPPG